EVRRPARSLAKGEPGPPVQAGPEGRVPDELHPAALVGEPLENDRLLSGKDAEGRKTGTEVADDGVGGGPVDPALVLQPSTGAVGIPLLQEMAHLGAQVGDLAGKLLGAARGFSQPEGHRRRR